MLYTVEVGYKALMTIDPNTAAVLWVGSLGGYSARGLAYDGNNMLYSTDAVNQRLLTINPSNGAVTVVNPSYHLGFNSVTSLAFVNGTLFGVDTITDQLITIDLTTGVGTAVGPVGFNNVFGLAAVTVPVPATTMLFLSGIGFLILVSKCDLFRCSLNLRQFS